MALWVPSGRGDEKGERAGERGKEGKGGKTPPAAEGWRFAAKAADNGGEKPASSSPGSSPIGEGVAKRRVG